LTYEDLLEAMADVDTIVRHFDPAAIEAIDDVLLELARNTEEFARRRGEPSRRNRDGVARRVLRRERGRRSRESSGDARGSIARLERAGIRPRRDCN